MKLFIDNVEQVGYKSPYDQHIVKEFLKNKGSVAKKRYFLFKSEDATRKVVAGRTLDEPQTWG